MGLAKYIDHTLLKTDAQRADVAKLIEEAKAYHFASVCVSPIWVSYVSEALRDTGIKTCTVIGFPQGGDTVRGQGVRDEAGGRGRRGRGRHGHRGRQA